MGGWAEGAGAPGKGTMTAILVLAALVALLLGWEYRRVMRRLSRGHARLEEAWREAAAAFRERIHALREFVGALERAGLVPEGRRAIRELIAEAEGTELDVEAIRTLDERIRTVLWRVFAALPRERPHPVREGQNRLAEAAEEFDLARRRYNELVKAWNGLLARFPYRFLATRHKFSPRELLPVRSEWELS